MNQTYSQIHIQVIAAVKFREAVINPSWKELVHKYITGIVQAYGHKMLAINAMPDHLHFFCGFRPSQAISDLVRMVKGDSPEWINNQKLTTRKFQWQEGYGAFSYSRNQVNSVIDYIKNQELHHRRIHFIDEYKSFLKEFAIEYNEKFIFRPLE